MDPWNCCCNINCLAKMHYTFIFNHRRVSKLSLEKEHCKQRRKQGVDGAGRCNFKRQMIGCQQAQMRECELVRCQLMRGHTFLSATWEPPALAFKKGKELELGPLNPHETRIHWKLKNADWLGSLCASNTICGCGVQRHAVFRQCIPLWWKWRRPHSRSLLWSCLSDLLQTWGWEQLSSLMAADHHTFWLPIMCYVSQVFHTHTENCPLGYYPLAPPLVIVWGQFTARPTCSPVCLDSQFHVDWLRCTRI